MKKINILFVISFIIFLPTLFLSCESTNFYFPIPGETKIFMQNMYKEYYNLGNAYFEIERYSDAIKYYQKASEDKSLKNVCDYKIAQCYAMSKNWSEALSLYNTILEADKDNLTIKTNIAYIYAMQGDFKNALTCYEELLEIQPDNLSYKENYLAIILNSLDIFKENQTKFEENFELLKTEYPKNKNIETFQKRYDEYIKSIEDEKAKESESKENDNSIKSSSTEQNNVTESTNTEQK